jgi:hypothetical protein
METQVNDRRWIIKAAVVLVLALALFWAVFYFCVDRAQKNDMPDGVSLSPVQVNEVYPDWVYFEARPGDTLEGDFWVWNGYEHEAAVNLGSLDVIDGSTLEDFQLKAAQDDQLGIGGWTKVQLSYLDLDSEQEKSVPFHLTVPEGTPYGTYMGAVYASYSPDAEDATFRTIYQSGLRVIVLVTDNPAEVSMINASVWSLPQISLTYFTLSVMITLGGMMTLGTAYRGVQS